MRSGVILLLFPFFVVACSSAEIQDAIERIRDLREHLRQHGGDTSALEELVHFTESNLDSARIVRVNALIALGGIAEFVSPSGRAKILHVLLENSRDFSPEIRRACFGALGRVAGEGEVPAAIIEAGLHERNTDVASLAAKLALKTRQYDQKVIEQLVDIVNDSRQQRALETKSAIRAIAEIPNPEKSVLDALINAFSGSDLEIAAEAAYAYSMLNGNAEQLLPVLRKLLGQPNYLVRLRALDAIEVVAKNAEGTDLQEKLLKICEQAFLGRDPVVEERANEVLAVISRLQQP